MIIAVFSISPGPNQRTILLMVCLGPTSRVSQIMQPYLDALELLMLLFGHWTGYEFGDSCGTAAVCVRGLDSQWERS